MMTRYSTTPRPEIVNHAKTFAGWSMTNLKAERIAAVARQDWLTYQTITYVLSTSFAPIGRQR